MTVCARFERISGQARGILRLCGPDARRFLQGIVSADLDALGPDTAVPAALLTVKGKLVSELVVMQSPGGELEVLVPTDTLDEVADMLDRFIVMDDVRIERPVDVSVALVFGTEVRAVSGRIPEKDAGVGFFTTTYPLPGVLVVGAGGEVDQVVLGDAELDTTQYEQMRVARAIAGWGAEARPGFFPPEVGLADLVSHRKGCYLGQEPMARIHARGQVQRVMVTLEATAATTMPAELSGEQRADAGTWTTCVIDGRQVRGLGIVRREFARPGTALQVPGEPPISVTITSGPIGDDPGLGQA